MGGKERKTNKWKAALVVMAVLCVIGVFGIIVNSIFQAKALWWKGIDTGYLVKEVSAGLSSYKLENGWYPVNSGDKKEGAFVLYKYLSGDFDEDGAVDSETAGNKVYMEGLDWNTAKNDPLKRVRKIGGRFALIDPYGDLIRYRCEPEEQEKRSTRNPTYDLWSLGGAESDADTMSNCSWWLTNWD
ncbi:MAG: hypothetical protein QM496_06345 [Verrucomicrobiota bacterium]